MSAGRASFRVPPRPEMPGEGPVSAGRAVRSLCVAPPARTTALAQLLATRSSREHWRWGPVSAGKRLRSRE